MEEANTFVSFPDKEEMLKELRSIDGAGPEHEPLFRLVAERLALKAYDRSAFVFILIELIYEFQEIYTGSLDRLLSQSVLVLTADQELTDSALRAFEEIKATLEPVESKDEPGSADQAEEPARGQDDGIQDPDEAFLEDAFPVQDSNPIGPYIARQKRPDEERLMVELQEAQKRLADLGFSTRMSIDMILSRSGSASISHTLREIAGLRATLRDFDALLTESEERILEMIGVLDED